jgi:hypothetical protein
LDLCFAKHFVRVQLTVLFWDGSSLAFRENPKRGVPATTCCPGRHAQRCPAPPCSEQRTSVHSVCIGEAHRFRQQPACYLPRSVEIARPGSAYFGAIDGHDRRCSNEFRPASIRGPWRGEAGVHRRHPAEACDVKIQIKFLLYRRISQQHS